MTKIEQLVDNTVTRLALMLEKSVDVQELLATAFGLKYLNTKRTNDNDYNAGRLLRLQKSLTGVTMQETMQQLEQLVLTSFQEIVELAPLSSYNDVLLAALSVKDMCDSFFNWIVVNEPESSETIMNQLTTARTQAVAALAERMTGLLAELTLPSQAKLLSKAIATLYDSTNSTTGYEKLLQLVVALDQKIVGNASDNSILFEQIQVDMEAIRAKLEDHLQQLTQIEADLSGVDLTLDSHLQQINQLNNTMVTHTHPYLPLAGGNMTGNISFSEVDNWIGWYRSSDYGLIRLHATADADSNYFEFRVGDNGTEYFLWNIINASTNHVPMELSWNHLLVRGEIQATGDITAFYSDIRLKEDIRPVSGALSAVLRWKAIRFKPNKLASCLGSYNRQSQEIGLIAQDVREDVPEAVCLAPFDRKTDRNEEGSRSGENYLTIKYYKLIPYLVQAIKELNTKVEAFAGGSHNGPAQ